MNFVFPTKIISSYFPIKKFYHLFSLAILIRMAPLFSLYSWQVEQSIVSTYFLNVNSKRFIIGHSSLQRVSTSLRWLFDGKPC